MEPTTERSWHLPQEDEQSTYQKKIFEFTRGGIQNLPEVGRNYNLMDEEMRIYQRKRSTPLQEGIRIYQRKTGSQQEEEIGTY